jgi:hypothetical protein
MNRFLGARAGVAFAPDTPASQWAPVAQSGSLGAAWVRLPENPGTFSD